MATQHVKVSLQNTALSWKTITPNTTSNAALARSWLRKWSSVSKSGGKHSPAALEKNRRRRMNKLGRLCAALTENPSVFLTLDFDRKVRRNWSITQCRKCFAKFRRFLLKAYPRCWFIYSMDYAPKTRFHFHMIGKFCEKANKARVISEWLRITGSTQSKMLDGQKYGLYHKWYLTSGTKAEGIRKVMEGLGRRSFWGTINKKCMPLSKQQDMKISPSRWRTFCNILRQEIEKAGDAQSSKNILRHPSGALNYCSADQLATAFKAIGIKYKRGWAWTGNCSITGNWPNFSVYRLVRSKILGAAFPTSLSRKMRGQIPLYGECASIWKKF